MTRLFKIKYIVIFMAALAIITSVTAFSVSYAKWTGGTDSITAGMSTGKWTPGILTPVSKYDFGLCDASTGEDFELNKKLDDDGYFEMYLLFTKDSTFTLKINGNLPDDKWKGCDLIIDEESGYADLYKVKSEGGSPKIIYIYGDESTMTATDVTNQVKTEGNDYYLDYGYGYKIRITDYLTKIN